MPRPRLLAITHDYTRTGAPILLFNLVTALAERFDLLVASPAPGPLQQDYFAARLHAIVVPELLNNVVMAAGLMTSFDVLLANTMLGFVPIHAARRVNKPSLWYLHESQLANTILQQGGAPGACRPSHWPKCNVVVPCEASRRFYALAHGRTSTSSPMASPRAPLASDHSTALPQPGRSSWALFAPSTRARARTSPPPRCGRSTIRTSSSTSSATSSSPISTASCSPNLVGCPTIRFWPEVKMSETGSLINARRHSCRSLMRTR